MALPQLFMVVFSATDVINQKKDGPVNRGNQIAVAVCAIPAIKFAFGFTGLSIVARFANLWAGATGVLCTAAGRFYQQRSCNGISSSGLLSAAISHIVLPRLRRCWQA